MCSGRLNGELRVRSHDAATWHFPSINGHVRMADGAFHFWDAPDDFAHAKLSLLFEGDRLYLHHAEGHFGAVPVSVTGEGCAAFVRCALNGKPFPVPVVSEGPSSHAPVPDSLSRSTQLRLAAYKMQCLHLVIDAVGKQGTSFSEAV